ncbi:hypothetical protein D3C71_1886450 [compost metagenome]
MRQPEADTVEAHDAAEIDCRKQPDLAVGKDGTDCHGPLLAVVIGEVGLDQGLLVVREPFCTTNAVVEIE